MTDQKCMLSTLHLMIVVCWEALSFSIRRGERESGRNKINKSGVFRPLFFTVSKVVGCGWFQITYGWKWIWRKYASNLAYSFCFELTLRYRKITLVTAILLGKKPTVRSQLGPTVNSCSLKGSHEKSFGLIHIVNRDRISCCDEWDSWPQNSIELSSASYCLFNQDFYRAQTSVLPMCFR